MEDTFAVVTDAISSVTGIESARITPESHIFDDLNIDSLDFLDVTFEIDKRLGIKIPVEDWFNDAKEGKSEHDMFMMRHFVEFVEQERQSMRPR